MLTIVAPPTSTDDHLDHVFRAMADRTRRALMARLARGPATISELALPFEMSLPAVSKHIRVLERGGLIARAVDGRVHRCQLNALAMRDADQWLSFYRVFWQDSLESLAEFVEKMPGQDAAPDETSSKTRNRR